VAGNWKNGGACLKAFVEDGMSLLKEKKKQKKRHPPTHHKNKQKNKNTKRKNKKNTKKTKKKEKKKKKKKKKKKQKGDLASRRAGGKGRENHRGVRGARVCQAASCQRPAFQADLCPHSGAIRVGGGAVRLKTVKVRGESLRCGWKGWEETRKERSWSC